MNSSTVAHSRARRNASMAARLGMMAATAVASGYLLIAVPNVELVTATVAMAGLMLGPGAGAITGILAMAIFGALNVFGLPYPPVWIAQMLGQAFTGVLFGLMRQPYDNASGMQRAWLGAALVFLATLFYDLITNAAFPLATGAPLEAWWAYFAAGIPFAVTHVVSNVLIFILVLPPAWIRIGRRYAEWREDGTASGTGEHPSRS